MKVKDHASGVATIPDDSGTTSRNAVQFLLANASAFQSGHVRWLTRRAPIRSSPIGFTGGRTPRSPIWARGVRPAIHPELLARIQTARGVAAGPLATHD